MFISRVISSHDHVRNIDVFNKVTIVKTSKIYNEVTRTGKTADVIISEEIEKYDYGTYSTFFSGCSCVFVDYDHCDHVEIVPLDIVLKYIPESIPKLSLAIWLKEDEKINPLHDFTLPSHFKSFEITTPHKSFTDKCLPILDRLPIGIKFLSVPCLTSLTNLPPTLEFLHVNNQSYRDIHDVMIKELLDVNPGLKTVSTGGKKFSRHTFEKISL